MLAPWAKDEMRVAEMGDQRLNRRLERLLSDLADRPTASIPAACGGRNEMVAAYRFFDNDAVTPESILQAHFARTRERMAGQKVALLAQDTTELDFTRPKQQVEGAGPMDGANRRGAFLHPLEENAEDASRYILDAVGKSPVLFTKQINVRGREPKVCCKTERRHQPRENRTAEVEVRATTVTLRPPPRRDRQLPQVALSIVWVRELHPPHGDVPVEWLLATTLPVETVEEVQTILQYYTVRFLIEVLFRVLKSGCRVEERLFEHIERLLPCVAVYLIVAWRTLMLCRLGRSCPDLDCEAVFEPSEWKSVWLTLRREPLPEQPPRLMEMMKLVAQLGGYVNYPNRKDPPGPQTVWLGLQRMKDLAWAWDTFGPGSHRETSPSAVTGAITCV